jgi:hypothetical protein
MERPAYDPKTTIGRTCGLPTGPCPVADLGLILEMLSRVFDRPIDQCLKVGDEPAGLRANSRDPFQGLDAEVIAAHVVQHHHVERCGSRTLLVEAAYVKPLCMGAAVYDLVQGSLVPMESKDHRLVCGEEVNEGGFIHAVWMLIAWKQCHQIDHIDEAHFEIGHMLP